MPRLQHGLAEGFFEPADDFTALISKLKRGFSLPAYMAVIRMEMVSKRLLAGAEADMDRNGDVYRGLMAGGVHGGAKCGYLYLFNVGTPRFDGLLAQSLVDLGEFFVFCVWW